MKKFNKIAMGILLASAASANAGVFDTATSQVTSVEAASTGATKVRFTNGHLVVSPGIDYDPGDRLTIELDNSATFADTSYVLEASTAGTTGSWVLTTATPAGASSLEFRAADTIPAGSDFILASSALGGFYINVPAKSAGSLVKVDASARDVIGIFDNFVAQTLLGYANQFSGAADNVADATIDVNDARLEFTDTSASDTIAFSFFNDPSDNVLDANQLILSDEDLVTISLSGNMSGIDSITVSDGTTNRGTMTITGDVATFNMSASDAFASGSAVLTLTADGTTPLATRTFTSQVDLNFETEVDKNLVAANTVAGEWDINGMQAKVSHLSLNTSGFISWLKVVNEGETSAEVSADIIWTTGGVEGSVTGASLATVPSGGVTTIGEAAILAAIGNPTGLVDVSMTVTVAAPTNLVHLTAEKKASDGRTQVPVYYYTTGANAREWLQ